MHPHSYTSSVERPGKVDRVLLASPEEVLDLTRNLESEGKEPKLSDILLNFDVTVQVKIEFVIRRPWSRALPPHERFCVLIMTKRN